MAQKSSKNNLHNFLRFYTFHFHLLFYAHLHKMCVLHRADRFLFRNSSMNGIVMLNMLNGPVSAFLKPKSKFFGNHVMDIMDVAPLVNILKIVKILRIYPPY